MDVGVHACIELAPGLAAIVGQEDAANLDAGEDAVGRLGQAIDRAHVGRARRRREVPARAGRQFVDVTQALPRAPGIGAAMDHRRLGPDIEVAGWRDGAGARIPLPQAALALGPELVQPVLWRRRDDGAVSPRHMADPLAGATEPARRAPSSSCQTPSLVPKTSVIKGAPLVGSVPPYPP